MDSAASHPAPSKVAVVMTAVPPSSAGGGNRPMSPRYKKRLVYPMGHALLGQKAAVVNKKHRKTTKATAAAERRNRGPTGTRELARLSSRTQWHGRQRAATAIVAQRRQRWRRTARDDEACHHMQQTASNTSETTTVKRRTNLLDHRQTLGRLKPRSSTALGPVRRSNTAPKPATQQRGTAEEGEEPWWRTAFANEEERQCSVTSDMDDPQRPVLTPASVRLDRLTDYTDAPIFIPHVGGQTKRSRRGRASTALGDYTEPQAVVFPTRAKTVASHRSVSAARAARLLPHCQDHISADHTEGERDGSADDILQCRRLIGRPASAAATVKSVGSLNRSESYSVSASKHKSGGMISGESSGRIDVMQKHSVRIASAQDTLENQNNNMKEAGYTHDASVSEDIANSEVTVHDHHDAHASNVSSAGQAGGDAVVHTSARKAACKVSSRHKVNKENILFDHVDAWPRVVWEAMARENRSRTQTVRVSGFASAGLVVGDAGRVYDRKARILSSRVCEYNALFKSGLQRRDADETKVSTELAVRSSAMSIAVQSAHGDDAMVPPCPIDEVQRLNALRDLRAFRCVGGSGKGRLDHEPNVGDEEDDVDVPVSMMSRMGDKGALESFMPHKAACVCRVVMDAFVVWVDDSGRVLPSLNAVTSSGDSSIKYVCKMLDMSWNRCIASMPPAPDTRRVDGGDTSPSAGAGRMANSMSKLQLLDVCSRVHAWLRSGLNCGAADRAEVVSRCDALVDACVVRDTLVGPISAVDYSFLIVSLAACIAYAKYPLNCKKDLPERDVTDSDIICVAQVLVSLLKCIEPKSAQKVDVRAHDSGRLVSELEGGIVETVNDDDVLDNMWRTKALKEILRRDRMLHQDDDRGRGAAAATSEEEEPLGREMSRADQLEAEHADDNSGVDDDCSADELDAVCLSSFVVSKVDMPSDVRGSQSKARSFRTFVSERDKVRAQVRRQFALRSEWQQPHRDTCIVVEPLASARPVSSLKGAVHTQGWNSMRPCGEGFVEELEVLGGGLPKPPPPLHRRVPWTSFWRM